MHMYITVEELKNFIVSVDGVEFTQAEDENLLRAAMAATNVVDGLTRTFFTDKQEIKTFDVNFSDVVFLPYDLLSVNSIKVGVGDGTFPYILTATDYILEPKTTTPKRWLKILPNSTQSLIIGTNTLQIDGVWGYCYADDRPKAIESVTLLIAYRIWKRAQIPFNRDNLGMFGQQTLLDDTEINTLLMALNLRIT